MGKKSKKDELKVSEIVEQEAIIEQHCQEQAINNQNPCEQEEVFDKELLVKSNTLACFGLHKDVIRAILTKESYTLSEAKNVIQKYIDSFNV